MEATLDSASLDGTGRKGLRQFFEHASAYLLGNETARPDHDELAARWDEQRILDDTIAAIAGGRSDEAIRLAPRFMSRPSVFVGLLARMLQSGRGGLISFVADGVQRDARLGTRRFGGRALIHYAAGAGSLEVVKALLRQGTDPDIQDAGGHTPLYRVANECAWETGPALVRVLVEAGADVNACAGVMRATPLHMAARRGFVEVAQALLDCGAAIEACDRNGVTPLQRAINCRKQAVAQLLKERGASRTQPAKTRDPNRRQARSGKC
jgi:hypothetical protein